MEFQVGQLDMKIAFLHGDLEEKTYMEQPEGFEVAPKEHSLVQKWAVLPVLNPLQSRFWNWKHESGIKGSLL